MSHKINNINVINLDSKKDRWELIKNDLNKNNKVPFNQFVAIDANNLNVSDYRNEINPTSKSFFMTKHIYAKTKSHLKLWEHIL